MNPERVERNLFLFLFGFGGSGEKRKTVLSFGSQKKTSGSEELKSLVVCFESGCCAFLDTFGLLKGIFEAIDLTLFWL